MIVRNTSRKSVVGETIEVAESASQKVKGLLGREGLEDGHGLLFKGTGSLHTLFMRFPIDIIYTDKRFKVVKTAKARTTAPICSHLWEARPLGAKWRQRSPKVSASPPQPQIHEQ